jgi:hypothetical protein
MQVSQNNDKNKCIYKALIWSMTCYHYYTSGTKTTTEQLQSANKRIVFLEHQTPTTLQIYLYG